MTRIIRKQPIFAVKRVAKYHQQINDSTVIEKRNVYADAAMGAEVSKIALQDKHDSLLRFIRINSWQTSSLQGLNLFSNILHKIHSI